ncbi:hypothetical protein PAHAL_3G211600 [Panicum hallii]|jgi:hypothetical protein|uniref:Uncharacterized protein n=1 Tax=Panicum hallii TaxID=206008 RepID=A0A2T8KJ14_9POAL|nr:hypothetical protein PAHAL_3G211600 [Panicum hallii]
MDEELQEADVLWPWTDTPPPSSSPEEEEGSYLLPAALPELYEHDAGAVEFSCEPFSGPPASSISSLTSSAQWFESDWSSDGFFLSGPSSAVSPGVGLDATEEFLEADVLWPDTNDDDEAGADGAAEFWWRCCRRVEEAAAAAAAAAAACGEREGWRPLVSSPIDIPMATRGAAAARRRPSPLSSAVLAVARRRR